MNRFPGFSKSEYGSYTEIGGAERFANVYKDDFKWCKDAEHWMRYNEKKGLWEFADESTMINQVGELAQLIENDTIETTLSDDDVKNVPKFIKSLRSGYTAKSVLNYAKARMACLQTDFDSKPEIIGLPGGKVMNLVTMEVMDAKREHMLTKKLAGNFIGVCSEEFLQFISRTFPDVDVLNYVQKYLGSCLLGYTLRKNDDKKVLFVDSSVPNTGKSTLLSLLEYALGEYFVSPPIGLLTEKTKDSNKPSPVLAELRGARIAGISEATSKMQISDDILKKLTGYDTIGARYPYDKKIFYYKPDFRLLVVSNELPRPENNEDIALRSRIRRITLTESIKDIDPNALTMIKKQEFLDSFVTWLVLGCEKYQKENIDNFDGKNLAESNLPEQMKTAIKKYFVQNDDLGDFFFTFYKMTGDKKDYMTFRDVFQQYQEYTNEKIGFYQFANMARTVFKRLKLKEERKLIKDEHNKWSKPNCIVGIKKLGREEAVVKVGKFVEDVAS